MKTCELQKSFLLAESVSVIVLLSWCFHVKAVYIIYFKKLILIYSAFLSVQMTYLKKFYTHQINKGTRDHSIKSSLQDYSKLALAECAKSTLQILVSFD